MPPQSPPELHLSISSHPLRQDQESQWGSTPSRATQSQMHINGYPQLIIIQNMVVVLECVRRSDRLLQIQPQSSTVRHLLDYDLSVVLLIKAHVGFPEHTTTQSCCSNQTLRQAVPCTHSCRYYCFPSPKNAKAEK